MMMYQIYLTILAILAFSNTIQAQFVDFSFEHSEKEYTSLVGATDITDDFIFDGDYLSLFLKLDEPVNISTSVGSITFDTIIIYATEMEMFFFEWRPELDVESEFNLLPFDLLLESTQLDNIIENESEIYYLFEEGISYFEFKNMKFYVDDLEELFPDARFTFTVSVRHSDGYITYYYGPSSFDPLALDILGEDISIGLDVWHYTPTESFYQVGIVTDNNDDVTLEVYSNFNDIPDNGLSYFPPPNTLYSFSLAEPTSQRLHTIDLEANIFPNPAYSELHINFDTQDLNGRIEIYNSSGQLILSNLPLANQVIPVGDLLPGLFTINFITDKGFQSMKWLKI